MDYIGVSNPVFYFLSNYFIRAFTMPEISVLKLNQLLAIQIAFFQGFLEGYNTMDVLAALALVSLFVNP